MAKIEMGISEYENMKKYEKMLEESLNKEREYQQQIKKLQEEKIEALQNSQQRVVKIIKKQVDEKILVKTEGYMNTSLLNKLQQLGFKSIYELADQIYKIEKINTKEEVETTLHGLDEIKEEIRLELENKYINDIKKCNDTENDLVNIKKRIEEVNEINTELKTKNEKLNTLNENLTKNVENVFKDKTELAYKLSKIKEQLKDIKLFNKSKILTNIKNLC